MQYKIDKIEHLRIRLREAYKKKHQGDNKALAKEKSTKKSENNPFFHALKKDLLDRFPEQTIGFSEYTLKRLFYDDNNFKYDEDTITFLEIFCQEIENQEESTEPSKEKINAPKRKKRYIWAYVLFSIIGLLLVVYLVLNSMGNRLIDEFDEAISGEFNPDPAGLGLGFLSINTFENNKANEFNSLDIPPIENNKFVGVMLYVDFHNMGIKNIKNGEVIFHFLDSINIPNYEITAELRGDNVKPIYDTVLLTGLPEKTQLALLNGYKENTHGKSDPNECLGYDYNITLSREVLDSKTIGLDELDTYQGGWCDQGFIIVQLGIKNIAEE